MDGLGPGEVTPLLRAWAGGDAHARDRLMALVYHRLRSLAGHMLPSDGGIQPTELVHEVHLKLARQSDVSMKDRTHFFAFASSVMRSILVDRARRGGAKKRDAGVRSDMDVDALPPAARDEPVDVLALDGALRELERLDQRRASVVELRFFGGLGDQEIAEFLGISARTVRREWNAAKFWLFRHLAPEQP